MDHEEIPSKVDIPDALYDDMEAMNRDAKGHYPWPWSADIMMCPLDGKGHIFGCACVREEHDLIPGAIRAYYRTAWAQEKRRTRRARGTGC